MPTGITCVHSQDTRSGLVISMSTATITRTITTSVTYKVGQKPEPATEAKPQWIQDELPFND
jgi:hypothetical protein